MANREDEFVITVITLFKMVQIWSIFAKTSIKYNFMKFRVVPHIYNNVKYLAT